MTTWVLLRGLTREAGHWGGFGPRLAAALGPDHTVLALDIPGNGELHRGHSPTRVQAMVQACRAALAARAVPGPYVLVAMSLGAMVALEWACTAADELAGCVLINTSVRGFSPFWHRLQPHNYPTLLRLMLPGATPEQRERAILRLTSSQPAQHSDVLPAWAAVARQRPVSRRNAAAQLLAAARYRLPAQRPLVPALVLASAGDRLVSARCSQALATGWDWPLRLHPDAGHDLALDDPAWVQQQITDWWLDSGLAGRGRLA